MDRAWPEFVLPDFQRLCGRSGNQELAAAVLTETFFCWEDDAVFDVDRPGRLDFA
jgi:hypothetical protein